jgi:hypothetical protein
MTTTTFCPAPENGDQISIDLGDRGRKRAKWSAVMTAGVYPRNEKRVRWEVRLTNFRC